MHQVGYNQASMKSRTRRWVSIAVLALLAFTQASLVFAACAMERGQLAQALAQPADHDCCDESDDGAVPMSANACLAHSTADLQISGAPLPAFAAIASVPVLHPAVERTLPVPRAAPPPRQRVPARILLHSFLI